MTIEPQCVAPIGNETIAYRAMELFDGPRAVLEGGVLVDYVHGQAEVWWLRSKYQALGPSPSFSERCALATILADRMSALLLQASATQQSSNHLNAYPRARIPRSRSASPPGPTTAIENAPGWKSRCATCWTSAGVTAAIDETTSSIGSISSGHQQRLTGALRQRHRRLQPEPEVAGREVARLFVSSSLAGSSAIRNSSSRITCVASSRCSSVTPALTLIVPMSL